jgi:predicted transcriptional regulator
VGVVTKAKRDTLAIVVDILSSVDTPHALRKTNIVHKSNLNFERIEKYLKLLLSADLIETIEFQDGIETYKITRKGQQFVSGYFKLMEILMANGSR